MIQRFNLSEAQVPKALGSQGFRCSIFSGFYFTFDRLLQVVPRGVLYIPKNMCPYCPIYSTLFSHCYGHGVVNVLPFSQCLCSKGHVFLVLYLISALCSVFYVLTIICFQGYVFLVIYVLSVLCSQILYCVPRGMCSQCLTFSVFFIARVT